MGNLPPILTRLIEQLTPRLGNRAYEVAVEALQKSGNLYPGTINPTPKGVRRGLMTPAERAQDRQAKYSGGQHDPSDYQYDPQTNRATLNRRGR